MHPDEDAQRPSPPHRVTAVEHLSSSSSSSSDAEEVETSFSKPATALLLSSGGRVGEGGGREDPVGTPSSWEPTLMHESKRPHEAYPPSREGPPAHTAETGLNPTDWYAAHDSREALPAPQTGQMNRDGTATSTTSTVSASGTATAAAHVISAPDYADRQRLLYHITYLSTQLQRAQLQLQEQARTMVILQAAASVTAARGPSDGAGCLDASHETVTLVLPKASVSTTAAVLAARSEEEVHAALSSRLALFDPVLAQETVYRLDSALAQLSLLREAESERLAKAEAELAELRTERIALAARVDALTGERDAWETTATELRTSNAALALEAAALRAEEARLVRQTAGMKQLMASGSMMEGVSVSGSGGVGLQEPNATSRQLLKQRDALAEAEAVARQALLQEQFWAPMLIAFDAGLTWMGESALLKEQLDQLQAMTSQQRSPAGDGPPLQGTASAPAALAKGTVIALVPEHQYPQLSHSRRGGSGGSAASNGGNGGGTTLLPPPTDADLLLMRSQQEEIVALKSRLSMHHERLRMAQLETDRLRFLYEGEQRRSEALAADHSRQLQRAYDELMRDRTLLAEQLRAEVEEQVRLAFRDGRRYERQRTQHKLSNSLNPADVASAAAVGADEVTDSQPVFLRHSREATAAGGGAPPPSPPQQQQQQQQRRPPHAESSKYAAAATRRSPPRFQHTKAAAFPAPSRGRPARGPMAFAAGAEMGRRPPKTSHKDHPPPDRPTASADGPSPDATSSSSSSAPASEPGPH